MGVILPALGTLAVLAGGAAAAAWLEPRILGVGRGGAAEAGPAAAVARRDVEPRPNDPWMYHAAPFVALLGAAWGAAVIPFGRELVGADVGIGLFYFIVVVDFLVLAVALGGWGANTRDAVEACYRAVAQLVAYVVPLGLAIIGPVMMARSLSTVDIVEAQRAAGLPYLLAQPLGFALYLACGLMQAYRAPFLEPFAGRLGDGVLGVYGGARAVLWRLALSALLFLVAGMGAVLFLGGYAGPRWGEWAPDWLWGGFWMAVKSGAMVALLAYLARRFRPRSTAAMLALAWKVLIPLGLFNVLLVGGLILLGVGQEPFGG